MHDALAVAQRAAALAPHATVRTGSGTAGNAIVGGEGLYVNVTTTNTTYNSGTQILQGTVTVQDLTTQPFGTADGETPSTNGIQIFFDELPTVTAGSGVVTVANPSGVGTFTQTGEPYFQYPGLLPSNATSPGAVWQFSMPTTVSNFTSLVYVATELPNNNASVITNIPAHAFDLLSAGQAHACAVRPGNHLYCWGANTYAAVGVVQTAPVTVPEGVLGLTTFGSVAGGTEFSCGLASNVPYCWGDNARGEDGDGTETDRQFPTAVAGGVTFSDIVAGTEFACALDGSGSAYCWGANSLGQLGDASTSDRAAPSVNKTVGNGQKFVAITTGAYHACGLDQTGAAYCWGGNVEGALGQSPDSVPHAAPVVVGGTQFTAIAAGDNFTCGVGVDTHVYCWGANTYGALGDGTTNDHATPAPVIGVTGQQFVAIAAGAYHACAATATGVAYCWGDNSSGQLGTGAPTTTDQPAPTVVSGPYAFTGLTAGFAHSCGLTGSGATYCWGDNSVGELGTGNTTASNVPVAVSLP